ncbi:hypothetical protein GCM10027265_17050 [Jatrophihabitans fulvus]
MLRWSVLGLALIVSLPTFYQGLVAQTISVDTMLIRFLVTLPIVGILLGFVRSAMRQRQ